MVQHLDSKCVLLSDPSTFVAGAKTRLASRIKKFKPPFNLCFAFSGGNSHLASVTSMGERISLAAAFMPQIAKLKRVWIGMTTMNIATGKLYDGIKNAWYWADGKFCNASGPALIGHEWQTPGDERAALDKKTPQCVYVDMQDGYKWVVSDCTNANVEHLLCERVENSCTAKRNIFHNSGGCGDTSTGGTGHGTCLNQPGFRYYCVCPAGEQIMSSEIAKENGAHHCEVCPGGADSACTFNLEGKKSGEPWTQAVCWEPPAVPLHPAPCTPCNDRLSRPLPFFGGGWRALV